MKKNHQLHFNRITKTAGFTLIELLVAVSIIILVLGGAVTLELQHSRSTNLNKHSLQAVNLAQEALNLTRAIRDNNLQTDENQPFANLNQGEYCLIKDEASNRLELKNYNDCSPEEQTTTLDSMNYQIKVIIDDPEDDSEGGE